MQETQVQPVGQEGPLEKGLATHSSILALTVLWSLAGYSPWGHKESDMPERLTLSLPSTAKTGKMKVKNTII